jgi:hypothetical protein
MLTWTLVDETAADLGATLAARLKWRQDGRGVPDSWRIKIVQALGAQGNHVNFSDFDALQSKPGRIAA